MDRIFETARPLCASDRLCPSRSIGATVLLGNSFWFWEPLKQEPAETGLRSHLLLSPPALPVCEYLDTKLSPPA